MSRGILVWPFLSICLSVHQSDHPYSVKILSLIIYTVITHLCLESHKRDIGKPCIPRSDDAECSTGCTVYHIYSNIQYISRGSRMDKFKVKIRTSMVSR